jgi:hypothetical protein
MNETRFNAPWSAALVVMTVFSGAFCLCMAGVGAVASFGKIPSIPSWAGWLMIPCPAALFVICAMFMVRGFVIAENSLFVKRLGWQNEFDLTRLVSATVDPNAVSGSIRIFGNGGFFSFTGLYRNSTLGMYRAYATDTKNAVVLRFTDRTIVVTPHDPQKFVAEIMRPLQNRPTA